MAGAGIFEGKAGIFEGGMGYLRGKLECWREKVVSLGKNSPPPHRPPLVNRILMLYRRIHFYYSTKQEKSSNAYNQIYLYFIRLRNVFHSFAVQCGNGGSGSYTVWL